MLIWMCTAAFAHPFESQFVGHKSTLEIHPNHLTVSFDLEVPLPLVERAFQESGHSNKKQWLQEWMVEQQNDIEENLWLEVDGVRQSEWEQVTHDRPMWKEASKFLVFSVTLEHTENKDMSSILMLDQVLIGEPSVYWADIMLSNDLVVYATDTIDLKEGNRYSTHLKRWEMEEHRREVRLAFGRPIWKTIDGWWRQNILQQSELSTVKAAFLPVDNWKEWRLGNTPFWMGLLSLLIAAVSGRNLHWKANIILSFGAILGVFVPLLPSMLRLGVLGILLLCMPFVRFRWAVVGMGLIVVCTPSWILLGGFLAGGIYRLSVFLISADKK